MIVNVPLVFDDESIQKKMDDDGYERCVAELMGDIRKSFLGRYSRKANIDEYELREGLRSIVIDRIDHYITNEWRDDIIDEAAKRLVERVVRSKKFKDKVEEVIDGNHS